MFTEEFDNVMRPAKRVRVEKKKEKKREESPPPPPVEEKKKKNKNGPRSACWQVTVHSENEDYYTGLKNWGKLVDDNFLQTKTWDGDRETVDYDRWRTVRHMSFQVEQCPTTDRTHAHVLVNFRTAHALKFVQDLVAPDLNSHCEIVKSPDMAFVYGTRMIGDDGIRKRAPDGHMGCTGAYVFGDTRFGQGQRTDINGAAGAILKGMSAVDVALKHTEVFFKYPKALQAFRAMVNPSKLRQVQVIYIYGPPRTGKSIGALQAFPAAFQKGSPSGTWWDGYSGEDVIVLDDVDKYWCSGADLMSWTDGLPLRVPVKGDMVSAHWDTVVLTGNRSWSDFIKKFPLEVGEALSARLSEEWFVSHWDEEPVSMSMKPPPLPVTASSKLSLVLKKRKHGERA